MAVRDVRVAAAPVIQAPEQFIGFKVGADNKLARWDKIVEYVQHVAAGSDRVRVRELGKTNGNNPFVVVEISSAETIKSLDKAKQLARKLYFQDGGGPGARERDEIFRRGKVVVLLTCSVHADEVGPTQASIELIHQLATSNEPNIRKILDNVIFLVVPSNNPDGQIMVTDWFNKNLGTPYETSPLPYLYHPYAGHDNNRDSIMNNMPETTNQNRVLFIEWIPQIMYNHHQTGPEGQIIFIPPFRDPFNYNFDPLIPLSVESLGVAMHSRLVARGLARFRRTATRPRVHRVHRDLRVGCVVSA